MPSTIELHSPVDSELLRFGARSVVKIIRMRLAHAEFLKGKIA